MSFWPSVLLPTAAFVVVAWLILSRPRAAGQGSRASASGPLWPLLALALLALAGWSLLGIHRSDPYLGLLRAGAALGAGGLAVHLITEWLDRPSADPTAAQAARARARVRSLQRRRPPQDPPAP